MSLDLTKKNFDAALKIWTVSGIIIDNNYTKRRPNVNIY